MSVSVSFIIPLSNDTCSIALPVFEGKSGQYLVQDGGDEFFENISYTEIMLPSNAIPYRGQQVKAGKKKVIAFIYNNQHHCGQVDNMADLANKLLKITPGDISLEIIKHSSARYSPDADYYRKIISRMPIRLTDTALKLYMQSIIQERAWSLLLSKVSDEEQENFISRLGAQVFYFDEKSELKFRSFDNTLQHESVLVEETLKSILGIFPWIENFTRPEADPEAISIEKTDTVYFETHKERRQKFFFSLVSSLSRQEERVAVSIYLIAINLIYWDDLLSWRWKAKSERSAIQNLIKHKDEFSEMKLERMILVTTHLVFKDWTTGDKWQYIMYLQKWFGSKIDIPKITSNAWGSRLDAERYDRLIKIIEEEEFLRLKKKLLDSAQTNQSVTSLAYKFFRYFEHRYWYNIAYKIYPEVRRRKEYLEDHLFEKFESNSDYEED